MHNYYNIIPSVLLDILVIFLLEGLVFYKFLFPMEKELAGNQLEDFNKQLNAYINDSVVQANLNDDIRKKIREYISLITSAEKKYLSESSNYFKIIFGLTCLGLFLAVYIYYFICKYTLGVSVDWTSIFICLFFIVVGIIGFEIIYFIYILLNKKINNQKIIKHFIDNALEEYGMIKNRMNKI